MINELAELVEMYEQGAWSRGDYFHRITLFVPDFSIDELIHELPTSDRDDFVGWLVKPMTTMCRRISSYRSGPEATPRRHASESMPQGLAARESLADDHHVGTSAR
jgi:hypothetical protein